MSIRAFYQTLAVLVLFACQPAEPPVAPPPGEMAVASAPEMQLFTDVAMKSGLKFTHFIGATGKYFMPEIIGSGGALVDYDSDGDLDIYLVQSDVLVDGMEPAETLFPPANNFVRGDRLFENRLIPDGALEFRDVTPDLLGDRAYGMGITVGDIDNDSDPDLYITRVGSNRLLRNDGDGKFTDITRLSKTDDPRWSTSATFVDYDLDGYLDLFVTNYLAFSIETHVDCSNPGGRLDYCGPSTRLPLSDSLFRNNGDGTFSDVSADTGILNRAGPGLGVTCTDFNGDGLPDIYVANDGAANFLWMNTGSGFVEKGLESGAAFDMRGVPEASMGVTASDFDNDGDDDLFMTHLTRETNTLYVNDGKGNFFDATERLSLGRSSVAMTGFGAGFFDFDNDGWLDVFIANGRVKSETASDEENDYPYAQINQLFRHNGGQFADITAAAGTEFERSEVSRGAVFGDVDNDGDIDILVTNNNGPVRLLLNNADASNHWLTLRLQGTVSNRDAIGARVALLRENAKPLWRRVHTDGSYLSSNDRRVHFGLGNPVDFSAVGVVWPSGRREAFTGLTANQEFLLVEGSGELWEPDAKNIRP